MKYKVGDKVRVVSLPEDNNPDMEKMVGKLCEVYAVLSENKYDYIIYQGDKKNSWFFNKENLEPVETTLYDLEVGDVVIDEYGNEKTALEVFTQSCLLSGYIHKDRIGAWCTLKELEEKGYIIKGTPETKPPVKMTVAEVAEKLGHEVEIVK